MASIISRIINRALGRPSAIKAISWSLGVHASVIAATYGWWSSAVDSIALSGRRNVVCVAEAFVGAEPQPHDHVVQVEPYVPPPESLELNREQRPAPTVVSLRPERLRIAKSDLVVQPTEAVCEPGDGPESDLLIKRQPQRVSSQWLDDFVEIQDARQCAALPRRQAEIVIPPTAVMVEQVVGLEDKTAPEFAGNLPPAYPAVAIQQRLEGVLLLRLYVAATGQVQRVEIFKSSGHAVLDRAAIEAVSTWRGRPAYQAGEPVATVAVLPVRFRL